MTPQTETIVAVTDLSNVELIARALRVKNSEFHPTLDAIVANSRDAVPGAQYAGLILLDRGRLIPQTTIGAPPAELDVLQQQLGTGPCFDAARDQEPVRILDVKEETRWPDVCRRASELGVASMLCMPLWVDAQCLGTLSLYFGTRVEFERRHEQAVSVYAALAALALADAQRMEQMQTALANRDVIGQAKGILMERHHLRADEAFAMLSASSQHVNTKLVAVAAHLADTGELPDA